MSESILKDKSYAFAIRIVEVSRFLSSEKRRICSEQTTPPIRDRCRGVDSGSGIWSIAGRFSQQDGDCLERGKRNAILAESFERH